MEDKKLNQNARTERKVKNSHPVEGCPKGGVVKTLKTKSENLTEKAIPRNSKNYHKLPHNPKLKIRARELRQAGNLSEVLFWKQVRNRQFLGLDFDRQKIIGSYIVDFYNANYQIVIEIDGKSHEFKIHYDEERDNFLRSLGLTVIHISAEDVLQRLDLVMKKLKEHPIFKK